MTAEDLTDWLENAIDDSFDLGWTSRDAATLIVSRMQAEGLVMAPAQPAADLVEALVDVSVSLAAAVSLLGKGGKSAKKAAPSDRMFDQMVKDYSASLERARAALSRYEKERTDG